MIVNVPGCTRLTGRPATILRLLQDANVIDTEPFAALDNADNENQADRILRELARYNKITIEEE